LLIVADFDMSDRFKVTDLPAELKSQIIRRKLATEEHLFNEGDPANAIYYLEMGQVRLLNYTLSGKTVSHYSVMAGEFFAEVLTILERCVCTAIAEEPSSILVIPKQAWLKTMQQHPNLAIAFAGEVSYRLHMVKITLQLRGIRSAQERVLSYLQIIAQPGTGIVKLDRPLKEVARDLDFTAETLSRVLTQLVAEGAIRRESGQIVLSK
jgi:CRP/FNR family transcriptional regulator, dissimilatory nitrate respiration regulator